MSNMGNYGLIIVKPPLKPDFMSKYQKIIGPRNKAKSPFYILHVHITKERGKNPMGNPPLSMDRKQNFGNLVINHSSPHDQKSLAMI